MDEIEQHIINAKVNFDRLPIFLDEIKWTGKKEKYSYFLSILLLILGLFYEIFTSAATYFESVQYVITGFLFALIIIPFHEFIHYLAYKMVGAKNISLFTYLNKGYVLIVANQFRMTKSEARWVLLSPFVIISILGLSLIYVVDSKYSIGIFGFLLLHTSICSTDLQLWSMFSSNKVSFMIADNKNQCFEFSQRTSK